MPAFVTLMSGSHQPLTPQLHALKRMSGSLAGISFQGGQLWGKGLVRPRH